VPNGRLLRRLFADSRLSVEVVAELQRRGHEVTLLPDGNFALPVAIVRDLASGMLHGGVTVPVPATAIGY
jgi:hypothetical protein